MDILSCYVREQYRYTRNNLRELFQLSQDEVCVFIKELKSLGVLATVDKNIQEKDRLDLLDEEIAASDEALPDNERYYVFKYVGIVANKNRIILCYPKYITVRNKLQSKMKQILKIIGRFGPKEQIIKFYNGEEDLKFFNFLGVILFLLDDYQENGLYDNQEDVIGINDNGTTLWEKTVSESVAYLSQGRPVYVDLFTRHETINDQDYFTRLHKCVLHLCTKQLEEAQLLDMFNVMRVEITDEGLNDFGDSAYILQRLLQELDAQFNTRKQIVLKAMYAFLENLSSKIGTLGVSMYGTTSFYNIWEKVCSEVFDNMRDIPLKGLPLPNGVPIDYKEENTLLDIIERPEWRGKKQDKTQFVKYASSTFIPDIVTLSYSGNKCILNILDAKYRCLCLEADKSLSGNPGVEEIAKQYLYQLAYGDFVNEAKIEAVTNCFLMPYEGDSIEDKGYAVLGMLKNIGLEDIAIRFLPAEKVYDCFLEHKNISITELNL